MSNSENSNSKLNLPKDCYVILDELTKDLNENGDVNTNKIQGLFLIFNKIGFDFAKLHGIIDNKLYAKLQVFNSQNNKNSNNKFNNLDNLIEYKNKLQEITKQYKQQTDTIKSTNPSSPNKKPSQKMTTNNNTKNQKTKVNESLNSTLNSKANQEEDSNKNAFNKLNDLKKKWKEINNKNFNSSQNMVNIDESDLNIKQEGKGESSDTYSKLEEIKNKLSKNKVNNK